ncbi:MAG TPA: M20/M25/M40 family metallo-hydrolase [Candidatus Acidoferrales bacterium]|nr:M20/M25/M40 family metallo-hydrolase [Candidatus Acidoferrales bacterium]
MNSKAKTKKPKSTAAFAEAIIALARSKDTGQYIQKLLVELCRINTTPNPDVSVMRDAEDRCFQILERELKALSFTGGRAARRPINPEIQSHPHYSLPHFTKTPQRPAGLSAEETYAGRSNLVYVVPGENNKKRGQSIALNAHVDVVAPYFPPRLANGIVFGRGACDDKGPLVAIVTALRILSEVISQGGLRWNRNVMAMFVVEEETGGNGSLSLATDRELKKLYDSVLVGECAGLKIYPANRGAVWYKAKLRPPSGVSAFEMSAFVIEEMEREGAAIRAESRHKLFPQRPVQTCHGIIGPFGEHPSRICGEARFTIQFNNRAARVMASGAATDCLESGLAQYIGLYGDKTKVSDAATGRPMVARHYDFKRRGNCFEVAVHGATGHMGAIRERDGAITKMAHLVRSLVFSKEKLTALAGPMRLELAGAARMASGAATETLILEGGQGFVPTHTMDEVMTRMREAAQRGAENYLRHCGLSESGAQFVTVTYEKLHNAAFDGDPDSRAMRNAIAAAKMSGIWRDEPVAGWTVSCDARLFATEYPGMPVLTFGPGELAFAHSDQEQISLRDVAKAAEFLAMFLLRQTGTI